MRLLSGKESVSLLGRPIATPHQGDGDRLAQPELIDEGACVCVGIRLNCK